MSLVASVAGLGLIFGLFLMLVPVALLVVLFLISKFVMTTH